MSFAKQLKYKQSKPSVAELNYKQKYDHTIGLLKAMNDDTSGSRER